MKQFILIMGLFVFGATASFAQCTGKASADAKANVETTETKAACADKASADAKSCCSKTATASTEEKAACTDKASTASKDGKACCSGTASAEEKAACTDKTSTASKDGKACCAKGTADATTPAPATKEEAKASGATQREQAKIAAKK